MKIKVRLQMEFKPTQAPHDQIIVACLGQMECPGTPGLLQAVGHLLQIILKWQSKLGPIHFFSVQWT